MAHIPKFPVFFLSCFLWLFGAVPVSADDQNDAKRFRFELEGGPVWQSKNDVRIPGDSGTEFSFKDLIGSGPFASGRFTFDWRISKRHGLRFIAAPLKIDGNGKLDRPVLFAGTDFAAGTPTKGTYRFDTYRIAYRYLFLNKDTWRMQAGVTILIRDAKIELRQASLRASDSNVGAAPLLNFSSDWKFAENWTAVLDFEGLAGGPGRALDLALKLNYDLTGQWLIGGGYRILEGGVDTDEVYNFSWFNYAFLNFGYQF